MAKRKPSQLTETRKVDEKEELPVPTYPGVDTEQAWFWTPEWQAEEHEADEDIRSGRVRRFDNAEDFLDTL